MSNLVTGKEATEGLMRGVKLATDLIRPTYGGRGSNVIIESKLYPYHMVVNDAQSIVQAIHTKGPVENRGLGFIKELTDRADKLAGDGRKTTCIILDEILTQGYAADIDKLQLKRELDALIPVIEKAIDTQTTQITPNEVDQVATTSSENQETGALLKEIYQKIGKDGIIHPQGSGTYETSYKFIDGVRFDMAGYLSPFMVHDEEARKDKVKETKAVYENPLILVTKRKITTDEDINPILWQMKNEGKKDLVIFTNDMDSGVASMLIDLHKSRTFNILIIKAPSLWQDYYFEDFARCTGATIIQDASGYSSFKNLPFEVLGTCGKIITDEEETVIIGTQDISEHIAALTAKADDDSNLRLSWLTNKSVILKIGANSETDLSYKRLKFQDAIRSSQLALKYGIVKGGGQTLFDIAAQMLDTTAGDVMAKALRAPHIQILENGTTMPLPDTIVDSAAVLKAAIRNAIGIASTILTASALVYIPELTEKEIKLLEINNQHDAF